MSYTARYEPLAHDESSAPRGRPRLGLLARLRWTLQRFDLDRRERRPHLLGAIAFLAIIIWLPLYALFSSGTPTDDGNASAASIRLAHKFAPRFYFAPDEEFFASSVEYFINGDITPKDSQNLDVPTPRPLTAEKLQTFPGGGDGIFLAVDISGVTVPPSTDAAAAKASRNFLRGDMKTAKVYAFVSRKPRGVVDIFYWVFCPFNLAKEIPPLKSRVGNHVGDWERIRVRTVHGEAVSVEYHAHEDQGSGTIPWSRVETVSSTQPAAYIAKGSHGFWATRGTFPIVRADIHGPDGKKNGGFVIRDETGMGKIWDTRNSLVTIDYIPDEKYPGALAWLNFAGLWGNPGSQSCPWYKLLPRCQLANAPPGPLRPAVYGRDNAMMHVLATLPKSPSAGSTYVIHVSSETRARWVAVRQICEVGGNGNADHAVTRAVIKAGADGAPVGYELVPPAETKNVTSSVVPLPAPVSGTDQVRVQASIVACPDGSVVTAYVAGACNSSDIKDCKFDTASRRLRAYETLEAKGLPLDGVKAARGIIVDDQDVWYF